MYRTEVKANMLDIEYLQNKQMQKKVLYYWGCFW